MILHRFQNSRRRNRGAGVMPVILFVGAIGAALSTSRVAAENVAAQPMALDEILKRNAEARGGVEAWRKINTMVQIGRIERTNEVPGNAQRPVPKARLSPEPGEIVSVRLELARPHKMRYELDYQGVVAIQAFDGQEGFTVQPGASGAIARPFTKSQNEAVAEQLDIEGPLLAAGPRGTTISLEGIESLADGDAYKLTMKLKNGVIRHVWVDAKSFLDVKIDGTRQLGDRLWPIETLFSDFRAVGGVKVPYKEETLVGHVHTMERMQLVKVMLNVPLENSRFTLPRATSPDKTSAEFQADPLLHRSRQGVQ